jgi:hypothetical protein
MNLKWIKILIINVSIFLILILILENTIFRSYFSKPVDYFSERSIRLSEVKPNSSFKIIETDHRKYSGISDTILLKSDKDGFIIGDDEPIVDDETKVIFFLGGSTTFCYACDNDKRFPYLSGKLLRDKKFKVKTYNGGVGGMNSYIQLLSFLSKGITKKPDYLVWMPLGVDLSQLSITGSHFDNIPSKSIITDKSLTNNKGLISKLRSIRDKYFYSSWLVFRNLFFGNKTISISKDLYDGYKEYYKNEHILNEIKKNLDVMIQICKIYNIELVLMTEFNLIDVKHPTYVDEYLRFYREKNIDDFVDLYKKSNKFLIEYSNLNNLGLIDLNGMIPKTQEYMYDSVHLTNEGCLLASKHISYYFTKLFGNDDI